jgi:serine protease AprX
MATPIVSGAVALMLQQNSSLTPDQVKARLMKTAWKGVGQFTSSHDSLGNLYNNEYDLFTYGAGYLDIDAALGNTDLATGVALSPTAVNTNGSLVRSSNTTRLRISPAAALFGAPLPWFGATRWFGVQTQFSSHFGSVGRHQRCLGGNLRCPATA